MKKYIKPDSYELEMMPQFIIAQSPSVPGSGQDFDTPLIVSDDDFNSMF